MGQKYSKLIVPTKNISYFYDLLQQIGVYLHSKIVKS